MVASKADIIAYESLGFSHLVYRGESYFVNLDSESSRLKFKEYLEEETGKEWCIAELERYVFYRKDMHRLVGNILMLNDTFQGKVEIPINTVSCECMFMDETLEGIDFSDFDTSGIENMRYMFKDCAFPEGFSLGDKFDTSKVGDMWGMFLNCTFPEGFSLGNRFDTSNVKDMEYMFTRAKFNKGFSLGNRFDTSKATKISSMFSECIFLESFSLGDKFDTSSVKSMDGMFSNCTLPEGFSLGDKFDTSSVTDMGGMFASCIFPEGFSLGDKFDTSRVESMGFMFYETQFNEDFTLAKNFTVCEKAEDMFYDAKLPGRVTEQLSGKVTAKEIAELLKSDSAAVKSALVTKVDFF